MPSIKTDFYMKHDDFLRIKTAVGRCGSSSEKVINNYMHNIAGKKLVQSMDKYIPVAKEDETHKHIPIRAKGNNWSEQAKYNLAVAVSNSLKGVRGTSFYYLYYVITGTGTSNPSKRKNGVGGIDFMSKGLDEEYNNLVDGLLNELDKNVEKELKV